VSRVLLATFGSLGDLHPTLAVGRAILARGHQAVVAASPEYRDAVEAAGLAFAPLRPSIDALGERRAVTKRLLHPLRGPERLLRDYVFPSLDDSLADLKAAAHGVDLFVSHPLTYTVPIVAQILGRPWMSTVLAPYSVLSKQAPPRIPGINLLQISQRCGPRVYDIAWRAMRAVLRRWERPLRALRAAHGLPDTGQVMTMEGQFAPLGTLALFDSVLATPGRDWPRPLTVCGAALYDGQAPEGQELEKLQRFLDAGAAPLVFALGSAAVWIADRYWLQAMEAAQSLGRRAILLTGDATALRPPPGILALRYLPYSMVFPRAAAVIHQAGIGTLSQALRAGRPQLITPVAFDQPDNAERAARLGVARVLPFPKVSARRLAEALDALLQDGQQTQAATALGQRLQGVDGAGVAADALIATARAS
jgi:rhamnosyltransferase subunit B